MKRVLLIMMAMLGTLTSWALMPVPGAGASVTEIADAAAFQSFIENGGNGKLTADITITENASWDMTADVTLDLNDHMVYAPGVAARGGFTITIKDSNTTHTTRYWKRTTPIGDPDYWEPSSSETEYTTEGGVAAMMIFSKGFVLQSGNICIWRVYTSSFNVSGGNFKFIDDFAIIHNQDFDSSLSGEGIMTGGTITYCTSGIYFPKATLLGGTITHNGFIRRLPIGGTQIDNLTLGGTIRIEGNKGSWIDDVDLKKDSYTLSFSTETPLTTSAHVGITMTDANDEHLKGTLIEGTADYTDYIFSSDAINMLKYDAKSQKTEIVARPMTPPTVEKPTFTVDVTDCTAAEVSYQWCVESKKDLTEDDCALVQCGTWNGKKLTAEDYGDVHVIVLALKKGGVVKITFDEDPGTLTSEVDNVFSTTSDPKVYTTETVSYSGYNALSIVCSKTFTVSMEGMTYVAVEGETTNTLSTTAAGTYACEVSIRGQKFLSDAITLTSETPTNVEAVEAAEGSKVVKTIENGQIVIIKDGIKYDIAGRKL